MEKKKFVMLCAVITATACLVTGLIVYFYNASLERGNEILLGSGNYTDISKYMEIGDLEKLIDDYYYKETDDDTLIDGSLKGMVDSLGDPYSSYYTEEEFKNYYANYEGTTVGIGAQLAPYTRDFGYLRVVTTYGGGPAEEAGILNGDMITAVDGISLMDLDYDGAVNLIYGPSGSKLTLTVETAGVPRNVELVRADVPTAAVFGTMLDDDVGMIIISDFKGVSVEQFQQALTNLTEEEEAKGIVIDLRDNVGTSLKAATDILDLIIPEGLLTYSVDKSGERSEVVADTKYNDIPIALIVNGATSNAAEIFTGAVMDNNRGAVVGNHTFGKAVSQVVEEMPYSGGGVKLTTAEYFTPKGTQINGAGLEPTIPIDMPADTSNLTNETDPQIQMAKQAVRDAIGG